MGALFVSVITSPDNDKLKTIRKLQQKSWRTKLGLFAAEGEDLSSGPDPEFVLRAGDRRGARLLDAVSTLGLGHPGDRRLQQRWASRGRLLVYLHGVEDPGNVGTIIRSAHAWPTRRSCSVPVPPDPYSPKAVRASMGSIFARRPRVRRSTHSRGKRWRSM
jgi:TrmH family RNA methyltransferase